MAWEVSAASIEAYRLILFDRFETIAGFGVGNWVMWDWEFIGLF